MKGGSLKPHEVKGFLQASYEKDAPMNIDGYVLDTQLSNLYGKVYVNDESKKIILAFRGTGMEKLGTDSKIQNRRQNVSRRHEEIQRV